MNEPTKREVVIDTCDSGHKFAKLEDHPKGPSGAWACPHCMVAGLVAVRSDLNLFENALDAIGVEIIRAGQSWSARKKP